MCCHSRSTIGDRILYRRYLALVTELLKRKTVGMKKLLAEQLDGFVCTLEIGTWGKFASGEMPRASKIVLNVHDPSIWIIAS
ncbi:hypothetical protein A9Q83_10585 [Alphaproteobacteria bacterium 46_93_T64]|nr:hypothetical protein A9Q83_10585 [Alphaproteobacteria bacterium 46_93_T64]